MAMRLFQLKIETHVVEAIRNRIEGTEQTVSSYIRQSVREKLDRVRNEDTLFKLMAAIKYGDCKKESLQAILEKNKK
jgi:vacuolar-type H+-ATPase subunit E/Vma4